MNGLDAACLELKRRQNIIYGDNFVNCPPFLNNMITRDVSQGQGW